MMAVSILVFLCSCLICRGDLTFFRDQSAVAEMNFVDVASRSCSELHSHVCCLQSRARSMGNVILHHCGSHQSGAVVYSWSFVANYRFTTDTDLFLAIREYLAAFVLLEYTMWVLIQCRTCFGSNVQLVIPIQDITNLSFAVQMWYTMRHTYLISCLAISMVDIVQRDSHARYALILTDNDANRCLFDPDIKH